MCEVCFANDFTNFAMMKLLPVLTKLIYLFLALILINVKGLCLGGLKMYMTIKEILAVALYLEIQWSFIADIRHKTRKDYHGTIKQVKNNRDTFLANKMAKSLTESNAPYFWDAVKNCLE